MKSSNAPLDRIKLFSFGSIQMRTFHLTWLMFFVCFFGWFGLAPRVGDAIWRARGGLYLSGVRVIEGGIPIGGKVVNFIDDGSDQ